MILENLTEERVIELILNYCKKTNCTPEEGTEHFLNKADSDGNLELFYLIDTLKDYIIESIENEL